MQGLICKSEFGARHVSPPTSAKTELNPTLPEKREALFPNRFTPSPEKLQTPRSYDSEACLSSLALVICV